MLYMQKLSAFSNWLVEASFPFNELIISWNCKRPKKGKYLFLVRAKTFTWSSWMLYAEWGSDFQATFSAQCQKTQVTIIQDTLTIPDAEATAFELRVECDRDDLKDAPIHVFACAADMRKRHEYALSEVNFSVCLPLKGLSQVALKLPYSLRICSPVSMAAIVGYLRQRPVNPVEMAQGVYDHGWDIYGNWVLNTAHASTLLDGAWHCWAEKKVTFKKALNFLEKNIPLAVSVQGPLPGSARPYQDGHLMVMMGYDSIAQKVVCMDPAFSEHEHTIIRYNLGQFLAAWNRRGNLAYLFSPL